MIARLPPLPALLGCGALILAGLLAAPWIHWNLGDIAFIGIALSQGGLAFLASRLALRLPTRTALRAGLGVAVVLRLALLPAPLHLSSDAYRYVWDGRVQAHGINPYRYLPAAPELAPLRDQAVFPRINRADYAPTIYPPAAQAFFLAVVAVSDSITAMKLGMLALEAGSILLILRLLRRFGRPPAAVVAYAWQPLALYEVAGQAHVDAAMTCGVLAGLALAAAGRRVPAAVALAVAVLCKPIALAALPAAWRPWDWRAPLAAVAVAVGLYLPYLSVGWGVLGFLPGYAQEESIATGSGFWLVAVIEALAGRSLPVLKPLYLAGAVAVLGWLALRLCFRRGDDPAALVRGTRDLLFAFVLLLSPNYPWYYLVLAPFLALAPTPALWAACVTCYVLYDEVWYDLTIPFFYRDSLLNVVVLLALAATWWRARTPTARGAPAAAPPEDRPA